MSDEIDSDYDSTDGEGEYLSSHEPKEPLWADGRTPDPSRICTARRTNGEKCRKVAIKGAVVCATHGGQAPQVKAKAKARLENAADRMAKELLHIAVDDDAPPAVKLNAIKDALDRAGLSPKQSVELEVGPLKPWEAALEGITGGSRAESRARRGLPLDDVDRALAAESSADRADPDGPSCAGCGRPFPAELLAWVEDVPEVCRECSESRELPPAFGDRGPTRGPLGLAPDLPPTGMPRRFRGLGGGDRPATPTANVDGEQGNGFMTHEEAVSAQRQANARRRPRY